MTPETKNPTSTKNKKEKIHSRIPTQGYNYKI